MVQSLKRNPGRFAWHQLNTTDPESAAAFYSTVAGWTTQPYPTDPSYQMWVAPSGPLGGTMSLPDEARRMGATAHWLPYLEVLDVDATVRQAGALGARVHVAPQDVPGSGRFAVLADPQGAIFAIYKADEQGKDSAPKRGEFSWHELATSDWPAAWEFYHALFEWEETDAMDMGPEGIYQMFGRAGRTLGGLYTKPAGVPAPPHWLSYVLVASADHAAALITLLGGTVTRGPMEIPGGPRIAMARDPQGAMFAVHSLAPAKKRKAKPKPKRKAKPKKKKVTKKRPARRATRKKRPVRARRR